MMLPPSCVCLSVVEGSRVFSLCCVGWVGDESRESKKYAFKFLSAWSFHMSPSQHIQSLTARHDGDSPHGYKIRHEQSLSWWSFRLITTWTQIMREDLCHVSRNKNDFFLSFKLEERLFYKSVSFSYRQRRDGCDRKTLIHSYCGKNKLHFFLLITECFQTVSWGFLHRASCGEKTTVETEQHCVYKLKPLFVILQHNSSDEFHSLNGKARCSVISLHAATWQTERGKTQQLSHSTNTSSNLGVKRNLAWCSYICVHTCVCSISHGEQMKV